ncbi:MAG: division/cell wall cluster transcriptional repressor MraZ [Desulfuromonadales bacterium]|nr:division/cell wall cluster transcriptional repressor MraZ [Desulfuromonadales bacterium]
MNFSGEYLNSIDAKGRASIPARFRDALAQQGDERLVVTKNLEGGLTAYPPPLWEQIRTNMENAPPTPKKNAMIRLLITPATECPFDKQGRIQLPQSLRSYAAVEKDIVVLGMFDKIEIYSQARYDEVMLRSGELLQADLQAVASMGF